MGLRRFLLLLEDALLVLMLAAMLFLSTAQIVLRNFFDSGISWGDPFLRLLVLWLALLGAMVATREKNHISIDLLSHFFSSKVQEKLQRITSLFTGIVCLLLSWHAARLVAMEKADGTVVFASVPAWLAEIIIPVGFGVMALRFLLTGISGNKAE